MLGLAEGFGMETAAESVEIKTEANMLKEFEIDYNNLDSLISASKPPIFWKEKPMVKKQLTIWSLNDLKTAIHEINDTEVLCKKNPQISKIIFFNFFTTLCKKANNFS